jgi:hypothetical protein
MVYDVTFHPTLQLDKLMSEEEPVGVFGPKVGLYDPSFEKDACGVGIVANLSGEPSHEVRSDIFPYYRAAFINLRTSPHPH